MYNWRSCVNVQPKWQIERAEKKRRRNKPPKQTQSIEICLRARESHNSLVFVGDICIFCVRQRVLRRFLYSFQVEWRLRKPPNMFMWTWWFSSPKTSFSLAPTAWHGQCYAETRRPIQQWVNSRADGNRTIFFFSLSRAHYLWHNCYVSALFPIFHADFGYSAFRAFCAQILKCATYKRLWKWTTKPVQRSNVLGSTSSHC